VKGSYMRKLAAAGAAAVAVLALSAASASADTWSGQCSFNGTGTFNPPYTYAVQNENFLANAQGTCTGTLNGSPYKGPAWLYIDGRMNAPMSCQEGANVTDRVPGTLTLGPDPTSVDAKQVSLIVPNVYVFFLDSFLIQGAYNGEAFGKWILQTGPNTITQCLPGRGLSKLNFTMTMQTITPLYG
jgi:hypothetical protein